jgi:hypothetical protein
MSWRLDSTAGAHVWDTQPLSDEEILGRDEELAWLRRHERQNWKLVNGRIAGQGDPTALEGTYGGVLAYPPAQNLAAVTGGTTNVAWWSAALYSPIPANSVLTPDCYRIIASGLITTSGAGQTIVPNANLGTAIGTALGAGVATTLGGTITAAQWYLLGDITIRTAGTGGTAIAQFVLKVGQAAGPSMGANVINSLFGGTAQTAIDFTAAQGITLGATPSAAGVSVTPTQVHWMSFNFECAVSSDQLHDARRLSTAEHRWSSRYRHHWHRRIRAGTEPGAGEDSDVHARGDSLAERGSSEDRQHHARRYRHQGHRSHRVRWHRGRGDGREGARSKPVSGDRVARFPLVKHVEHQSSPDAHIGLLARGHPEPQRRPPSGRCDGVAGVVCSGARTVAGGCYAAHSLRFA